MESCQIRTFNNKILYVVIVHRVLWKRNSRKSGKGLTCINYNIKKWTGVERVAKSCRWETNIDQKLKKRGKLCLVKGSPGIAFCLRFLGKMECYTKHLGLWGVVSNCRNVVKLPNPPSSSLSFVAPDLAKAWLLACALAGTRCSRDKKDKAASKPRRVQQKRKQGGRRKIILHPHCSGV